MVKMKGEQLMVIKWERGGLMVDKVGKGRANGGQDGIMVVKFLLSKRCSTSFHNFNHRSSFMLGSLI